MQTAIPCPFRKPNPPHFHTTSVQLLRVSSRDHVNLSITAPRWNWSTSDRSFLKEPTLCPFPKLWLGLRINLTHGCHH